MIAGILARVAFSAFGKNITIGLILRIIAGIITAGLLWLAYSKIKDHFQHISDLEVRVTQLNDDNSKLTSQKDELIKLNKQNAQVNQAATEQRDAATGIANTETAATTTRTTKYKEIRDVIKASPVADKPVDPLVLRTLDSVWGPEPPQNGK